MVDVETRGDAGASLVLPCTPVALDLVRTAVGANGPHLAFLAPMAPTAVHARNGRMGGSAGCPGTRVREVSHTLTHDILKRRYSVAMRKNARPRAGEKVVLVAIPPGLLDGLRDEDQRAINAIMGKPVKLCGYDDSGRAELEFDDPCDDSSHTIWVAPEFIQSIC